MDTAVDVAAAADLHWGEVAGYGGGGLYRWSDGGFHVVTSKYRPSAIVQIHGTQPGGFGRPRAGMELFGSLGQRRAVDLPFGEEAGEGHHWSGTSADEQFPGHQHRVGRSTAWWTEIRIGDVESGGHPGRDGPTLRAERNTQIVAGQIGGREPGSQAHSHDCSCRGADHHIGASGIPSGGGSQGGEHPGVMGCPVVPAGTQHHSHGDHRPMVAHGQWGGCRGVSGGLLPTGRLVVRSNSGYGP